MTLKAVLLGEDRSMSKSFKGASGEAEKTGSKLKTAIGVGAAAAGAAMVAFATDSISKASDLNETISKSNTIFGKNAGTISKWADGAAKSMGLSKQAALDSAAGFGDMFSQIGFSGDNAAKMSQKVVQLSADLGSFNNLPTEDVAQRMSAAFRGEFDSLQALVPNINAARVEQEALAMTHKKSAKDLTASEKAAATLAIVTKDGSRAAGDFARTSGGLANQQKIAKAQFENLQTTIGTKLLPIVLRLTTAGLKMVDWMQKNSTVVKIGVGILGGLVAIIGSVIGVAKVYTAVQTALNIVLSANPIGLVIIAIAALVAGLIIAYKNSETFRNVVQTAFRAIGAAASYMWHNVIAPVLAFLLNAFDKVTGYYSTMLRALSHIPGFGWAGKAADALDRAGDKARALAKAITAIPAKKTVTVNTYFQTHGEKPYGYTSATGSAAGVKGYAVGGTNLPRGWKIVGEDGPELMWTPGGETVIPSGQTRSLMGGGSGGAGGVGSQAVSVNLYLDGSKIHESLLRLKRTRGGNLELA